MGWLIFLIVLIAAAVALVVYLVARTHQKKVAAGREELIGKTATVEVALAPKGTVFIEGELWDAEIDQGRAEPKEEVIITAVDDLKLKVTRPH